MSQNPTDLRLEDLPELNAYPINKAKKEATVLLTVVFWDIRAISSHHSWGRFKYRPSRFACALRICSFCKLLNIWEHMRACVIKEL